MSLARTVVPVATVIAVTAEVPASLAVTAKVPVTAVVPLTTGTASCSKGFARCVQLGGDISAVPEEVHVVLTAKSDGSCGQTAGSSTVCTSPNTVIPKPVETDATQPSLLPVRTKLLLSLGEAVQGIWVTMAGFFLNVYFLEVCCLDPASVSGIQLIQGLFDCANDPFIGYLSDHTRTRWGRRRPWLLFGGPFLAISYFGLWSKASDDWDEGLRLLYYLVCYMGVSVGVTCVQIQIGSLVPELTDDYNERTAIGAYRILAVILAGLICVLSHGVILGLAETREEGYRISGAVFAIVILICYLDGLQWHP